MIVKTNTTGIVQWNLASEQLPREYQKRYLCCDKLDGETYLGRLWLTRTFASSPKGAPNKIAPSWIDCIKLENRKPLYWAEIPRAPWQPVVQVMRMDLSGRPAKGHAANFECETCGNKIGEREFAIATVCIDGQYHEPTCRICEDCIKCVQKSRELTEAAKAE